MIILRAEVAKLVSKGVVQQVDYIPKYVHPLSVAAKTNYETMEMIFRHIIISILISIRIIFYYKDVYISFTLIYIIFTTFTNCFKNRTQHIFLFVLIFNITDS